MSIPEMIGSFGVFMLLVAFTLLLLRKIKEHSLLYLFFNILGAYLAVVYAWTSGSVPFVILESVWGTTALIRLLLHIKNGSYTIV